MRCIICNTQKPDQWVNVDQFRHKASGMCLCNVCGFVSYPTIIENQKDLKEFYREEYRDTPTVNNIYSGQRKLHYHHAFLNDLFNEWRKKKFATPEVYEVGAAFGLFLSWFRGFFPKASLGGTELTTTFRRNAFHEYGVKLSEEFDYSKKHDLIVSYKVAEHIPDMDIELRKYAENLTENGFLYISVPIWFTVLNNFGSSGFSLEYYYHKNHINVWSPKHFDTLLKKCGLEIVKQNHTYYDSTFLCKRNDALMLLPLEFEKPEEVLGWLNKIHLAALAYDAGKFTDAVGHWPFFPEAQVGRYESNRSTAHKNGGWEAVKRDFVEPMLRDCPDNAQIALFAADLMMRYSQWDIAIKQLEKCIEMRPNDPPALIALGHCFRHASTAIEDPAEKLRLFQEARTVTRFLKDTSFQNQHEAITWIFNDNARLPMEGEPGYLPMEPQKKFQPLTVPGGPPNVEAKSTEESPTQLKEANG